MFFKKNKSQNNKNNEKKKKHRYYGILLIIIISSPLLCFFNEEESLERMAYLEFTQYLNSGKVDVVEFTENQQDIIVTLKDKTSYLVTNPNYDTFPKELLEAGASITYQRNFLSQILKNIKALGLIFIEALFLFTLLFTIKNTGISFRINNSKKELDENHRITFDDIAGMSEIKEEVKFAISQLKDGNKLKKMGTKPCKGILLEGPPGTGKTLLAKAIAGEAKVPFFSVCGSDFNSYYMGMGSARVKQLWEEARENAPCVLFIDEFDAVAAKRTSNNTPAARDLNQTIDELLKQMDGTDGFSGILVIAATNRVKDLDSAILRPGRFDKKLYIGPPSTKKDRDEIINLYLKNKKTSSENFDFEKVSKLMFGLTGAEIEQALNEAVKISIQNNKDGVLSTGDVDAAVMKLRFSGVSTKHSSAKDMHITAIHESGHAVVSCLLGQKVYKVSITPYSSGVGGMTIQDTDEMENKKFYSKTELENKIKVLLAGRMSEEILLGESSIGCSNDLEAATTLAYDMVTKYGMFEDSLISLHSLTSISPISANPETILQKVELILNKNNAEVKQLIIEHKVDIQKLAERLEIEEDIYDFNLPTEAKNI